MKIMITGVAGFIGSNLARVLIAQGHKVTGIDNLSYGSFQNIEHIIRHPNFSFIMGDLANPLLLKDVKADVTVHLASQKIPRYTSSLRTLEENYLMLRNVLQKCHTDKSKIVFASSSDVYGKSQESFLGEESDLILGPPSVRRWTYASSKITGEQLVMAYSEEFDLTYTTMRLFATYGPNQNTSWWGGPQSVFIRNILENRPLEIHGNGLQTRTFSYIDDTVDGIIRCITDEKSNNNLFNISGDPREEISIKDLAVKIWHMMKGDTQPVLNYIPYSSFGKYEDAKSRRADITKARVLLGYEPKIRLEEGLRLTIDWQKQQPATTQHDKVLH